MSAVACSELFSTLRDLAARPENRVKLVAALGKAGIRVNNNLEVTHPIPDNVLRGLPAHLSSNVVWSLAARRILRSHNLG